jgi:hypothetical protein
MSSRKIEYQLNKQQLKMLEERRADHISGKSKSFTLEEVREYLLAALKKNRTKRYKKRG